MKISDVTGVFQAVLTCIAVIVSIVSLNIASKTFSSGPVPKKSLVYSDFGASDALAQLRNAGGLINLSIKLEGKSIKDLFIMTSTLTNNGLAPITPSDIIDGIEISTEDPWRIIAVSNNSLGGQFIAFDWDRISETKYKARKTLINPGDMVILSVYFTRSDAAGKSQEPSLHWSARISNLPSIQNSSDRAEEIRSPIIPVYTFMNGNGILFTLLSFLVYTISYLFLLQDVGFKLELNIKPLFVYTAFVLLSLLGAESGNAYVFGSTFAHAMPFADNYYNLPFLAANWCALGFLIANRSKRRRTLQA